VQETVGERVRRLRIARGLSQRELSEPGVSYAYISRIEANARTPSVKALRKLARKLGVTPEYIETGEPIAAAAHRELRLSDAELEVRVGLDLDKAEAVFREEADAAGTDSELVARAHAGLGLLAARRSRPREAITLLEAATESGHLNPETRPDVYDVLGEMYVAVDRAPRAVALFESCLRTVGDQAPDDATLHARFAVRLAAAHAAIGALEPARGALNEATDAARERPIPLSRVRLYWMKGIEAWQEADSEAALAYIRRAIGLLEAEEDTVQLARAHVVAARMLTLDARSDEAGVHLKLAERMFTLGGTPVDVGILRAEQAKLAAKAGDAEAALSLAREAADLLREDARYRSNVWHALAAGHQAAGNFEEAETNYRQALEELMRTREWREAAQVSRELSKLLRTLGRDAEAYDLLDRAALLIIRHVGGAQRRARDRAEIGE
jgi:transcriptional regulator with XRE-family HTH domain